MVPADKTCANGTSLIRSACTTSHGTAVTTTSARLIHTIRASFERTMTATRAAAGAPQRRFADKRAKE